jgi:hypothetical protein
MVEELGKLLVIVGLFFILFGALLLVGGKLFSSLPLGKLPGDILIKKENFVFYFPLGTSLLISLLLTGLSFLLFLIMRKQ